MNDSTFALSTVAAKVADVFPNFKPSVSFEEKAKEWISITHKIVTFKADKAECNVKVIVRTSYDKHRQEDVYTLLRFFPGGNSWQVSVDVNEKNAIQVFNSLLDVSEEDF
jgi:hypothetical protein